MPLLLSHVGEELVTRMANELREDFVNLCGLNAENGLAELNQVAFPEVKLSAYSGIGFDGASRVDMIFLLSAEQAIPFEIKLGTTRLSKTRIDEEWLNGCEFSHGNRRFKGNMMSILEREFPAAVALGDLKVELPQNHQVTLTQEWFLIARQKTINSWKGDGRPAFSDRVRFLAFESIVQAYGGQQRFNDLVWEMLNFDFFKNWVQDE